MLTEADRDLLRAVDRTLVAAKRSSLLRSTTSAAASALAHNFQTQKRDILAGLLTSREAFNFDPNEPRDKLGKWTRIGGGSVIDLKRNLPGERFPLPVESGEVLIKAARRWRDSLTKHQTFSFEAWGSYGRFEPMQELWRFGRVENLRSFSNPGGYDAAIKQIKSFQRGFIAAMKTDAAEMPIGVNTYRGLVATGMFNPARDLKVGTVFHDKGVQATTYDSDAALEYMTGGRTAGHKPSRANDGSVLLRIAVPKGMHVGLDEWEIDLPPMTRLRVTKVTPPEGDPSNEYDFRRWPTVDCEVVRRASKA